MGKKFETINSEFRIFIENQKVFFVGTAASNGRVNISPKGTDSLRIINGNKIVWLNLTGSGNESAAHLLKNSRMTIMFLWIRRKAHDFKTLWKGSYLSSTR